VRGKRERGENAVTLTTMGTIKLDNSSIAPKVEVGNDRGIGRERRVRKIKPNATSQRRAFEKGILDTWGEGNTSAGRHLHSNCETSREEKAAHKTKR